MLELFKKEANKFISSCIECRRVSQTRSRLAPESIQLRLVTPGMFGLISGIRGTSWAVTTTCSELATVNWLKYNVQSWTKIYP